MWFSVKTRTLKSKYEIIKGMVLKKLPSSEKRFIENREKTWSIFFQAYNIMYVSLSNFIKSDYFGSLNRKCLVGWGTVLYFMKTITRF